MKVKLSKGFEFKRSEYDSIYEWDCFCQAGTSGIVFSTEGNYETAFFEAFPNNPSCFIRGEGKDLDEAEKKAWDKYQKILVCDHEMERRDRKDGYGYCKHCSYSSKVFEPLTKCCKCNTPTNYSTDYKGNHYCKKHDRCKPKNPNPTKWELHRERKRLPRKLKKKLKSAATQIFRLNGHSDKVYLTVTLLTRFTCGNREISLLFKKQQKNLIEKSEYAIRFFGKKY